MSKFELEAAGVTSPEQNHMRLGADSGPRRDSSHPGSVAGLAVYAGQAPSLGDQVLDPAGRNVLLLPGNRASVSIGRQWGPPNIGKRRHFAPPHNTIE